MSEGHLRKRQKRLRMLMTDGRTVCYNGFCDIKNDDWIVIFTLTSKTFQKLLYIFLFWLCFQLWKINDSPYLWHFWKIPSIRWISSFTVTFSWPRQNLQASRKNLFDFIVEIHENKVYIFDQLYVMSLLLICIIQKRT